MTPEKKERPRSREAFTQGEARRLKERALRVSDGCTQPEWKDALLSLAAGALQIEKLWYSTKRRKLVRKKPKKVKKT